MKNLVIGILAHVDAGKTTLSEALLYHSGALSSQGRVDKGSTFLDTDTEERRRGITIFSKQAIITTESSAITLIDTPGHIDFSCEAQRALSIQDYAILVISADEGVTPYTKALWNLLSSRKIPTFIFVNKTDISNRRRVDILEELKATLNRGVCSFSTRKSEADKFFEDCASQDESLMKSYFEKGNLSEEEIAISVRACKIFPCYFGSALRLTGTKELLSDIDTFTVAKNYSKNLFGAKVYKIARDPAGVRLTYMKITGGRLNLKDSLTVRGKGGVSVSEKVDSIRLYSGEKFKSLKVAEAGMVCAIPGLTHTWAGLGIGTEGNDDITTEPALEYKINLPEGTDAYEAYLKISTLTEEDPTLAIRFDTPLREIRIKLMGDIQTEVLTEIIKSRFGISVTFSEGNILYKETISDTTYGNGHFEPLMHYAEVRLRMEPLPRGSGLVFTSECPTDTLKSNWQRLILSALEGHNHRGVLTGSPITDMKIVLIGGRAHPKHTDGGDFREAAIRAVRQGLMKAESLLLEPSFDFEIKLPQELVGKVMTDIDNMSGTCDSPEYLTRDGSNGADVAILRGNAPVAAVRSYPIKLRAFSRGEGSIMLIPADYVPCVNEEEIIEKKNYDPELDSDVAGSVFCKGGAGYAVPWYEVDEKMHTEDPSRETGESSDRKATGGGYSKSYRGTVEEDRELLKIFEATYGKIKPRTVSERVENSADTPRENKRKKPPLKKEEYTIIDGYNLIFSSEPLKKLAKAELSHARDTLIRMLSNYGATRRGKILVVFDAYKQKGCESYEEEVGSLTVIYTKEAETADAYIEKATYGMAKDYTVRVVTSDYTEQLVILGFGGIRITAKEFLAELERSSAELSELLGESFSQK